MQSKAHPISRVICHPVYCLASVGAVEKSRQSDGRPDRNPSSSPGGASGESIAQATSPSASQPWTILRAAYASLARKAVTIVTLARRRQVRRLRLDPAVGALRDAGLFLRPHPVRWRDDEAGGEAQLVPTPVATDPLQ